MNKTFSLRIFSLIISICLFASLLPLPVADAANYNMEYFFKKYSDPRFNLANEPDRVMTIEEFIAIIYAYSYYGDGVAPYSVPDKNGREPSSWCARYVCAEVSKKVIDPGKISWSDPVTIAFAAQYLCRAKGKYSYDSNNLYSFTGTGNLSADDILYLSVAADHKLIEYTSGMDVSKTIRRRDALKYEVPKNAVYAQPIFNGSGNTMRECNAYFIDCYWDLDAAQKQFNSLKSLRDHITMVTFQCGYINNYNISDGNTYLGYDLEHEEALKYNNDYDYDPQLQAVAYCHTSGISALFGISNVSNNAFPAETVANMLKDTSSMRIAVNEIMYVVDKYGFDGVNMGIELPATQYSHLRNSYSTFIGMLGNALHAKNKLLMVSAGAYFTDSQEAASIYDYSAIGKVADFIHIILYDDYNDTSFTYRKTYGPMSNLLRIGRCLRYASTKTDRRKLLLGMGSFAIDFNLTWTTAQDINYQDSVALRNQYNAPVVYQNANGEAGAYFEYTDTSSCRHRVYMETPDTAAQRAKYVASYNLGGFSVFNLNDNYTGLFSAISNASAYKSEIMTAMKNSLVPNVIRGEYDRPILRYEFCSIITAIIEECTFGTAEEFLASKGVQINTSVFSDTSSRDVLVANALGIVQGYGNREFRPNNTITRAEAATMLMRLAKTLGLTSPNSSPVSFAELSSMQEWAKEGVSFISACLDPVSGKRVMGGTGNNKFSPNSNYTREQSIMTSVRLFNLLRKS